MKSKKFFVEIFMSKKGRRCVALKCDLGYTQTFLNFDVQTIAEIMGVSVSELYDKPLGTYDIA